VWLRGSSSGRLRSGDDDFVFVSGQRKKWQKGKTMLALGPFIDGVMRRSSGDNAKVRPIGAHRMLWWHQIIGLWCAAVD
jgi:hypothetical protein